MTININPQRAAATAAIPDFKAVEFELALGAQDICADSFESCVASAAKEAGFMPLFNLPIPVDHFLQRLAAFAAVYDGKVIFVFVGLHRDGNRAIIQPDLSELPHIEKFAEAFFDLVTN